jgi:hypothetical protein
MDDLQRRRPLGLIQRPGDVVDLFCSDCGRVVFTIEMEEPHPVETQRLVEASHAIKCLGPGQN